MLFRSFLLLVGASLQTLYVVAAQNPKEHYSKPAPEISPYPEPKPTSWLSKPKPTWTLEPSRLVPSPPFSMPTPWPSSVLIDPNPTWEPQPTVNEPSESQTTPLEPSPSHSVPQKLARPKPPKNARPAEHERSFRPSSRCSSEINREAFNQGVNYGKVFVQYTLVGREDCTKYKNTLQLLEQTGPTSPIYPTREPLPTYCKKYGFYQAFASAVADFEKACSGCPFNGFEIGHRAGLLFCNFPSFINIEECSHKPAQPGCYEKFYWALLDTCGVNYLQMFNSPRAMELRQRLSCHQ